MEKEYNISDEQYNKLLDAMFSCFVNVTGLEYFDFSDDAEVNGKDTLNAMIKNFEKRNKYKEVDIIKNLLEPKILDTDIDIQSHIESVKKLKRLE